MSENKKRGPTSLETIQALKRAKFQAFIKDIKDAQDFLREEIKTIQARLLAIEDFLTEDSCSETSEDGDREAVRTQGEGDSDYFPSTSYTNGYGDPSQ